MKLSRWENTNLVTEQKEIEDIQEIDQQMKYPMAERKPERKEVQHIEASVQMDGLHFLVQGHPTKKMQVQEQRLYG